ncbi:MAG: anaerobic ribonucleoside-triphosphate reductase activating protein [Candidatus Aminicenantales bacterium]
MVEIKGLEKFAPRDFPGHISATFFVGDCNFRCPYCHNAELVLRPEALPTFPMDYVFRFLDSRKGWLEGVCITGGEPLLHPGLPVFLRQLKQKHLLVKLDTNGSLPSVLEDLIAENLVDVIAMDVKTSLEKYPEATRSAVPAENIQESVDLIRRAPVDHVFRTTVVPGLVDGEDILKIGRMLEGGRLFLLQQFAPHNTLDPALEKVSAYPLEKIQEFAESVKEFFEEVRVEGL